MLTTVASCVGSRFSKFACVSAGLRHASRLSAASSS